MNDKDLAPEPIDATDAALALANEKQINLRNVQGTGANGRITKGDVEAYLATLPANVLPPDETSGPAEPERRAALVSDVNAHLTDAGGELDEAEQAIAQLPSLAAVIGWTGDREKYARQLQHRAKELLERA